MSTRPRSARAIPPWRMRPILGAALILCLASAARPVEFTAQFEGGERRAVVDPVVREGASYIPLSAVVKAYGGAVSVFPDRLQIDLAGKTAVIGSASTKVSTSGGQFSLSKPLLLDLVDGYLAVEDLPAFFANAFALQVRPIDTAVPAPPAPQPARELIEVEPLEPLKPTAPESPAEGQETNLTEPMPDMAPAATAGMKGNVIILDAGHGGSDKGVESASGIKEKELALALVERIRKRLEAAGGFTVAITRDGDLDLSSRKRVDFANERLGSLFVSIHAGASPSDRPHGVEIFYPYGPGGADGGKGTGRTRSLLGEPLNNYSAGSRRAADLVGEAVVQLSPAEFAGVSQTPLRLAAGLTMPCLLIEVGHLTNNTEDSLLGTAHYQDELSAAIASGIVAAFKGTAVQGAAQ